MSTIKIKQVKSRIGDVYKRQVGDVIVVSVKSVIPSRDVKKGAVSKEIGRASCRERV